MDKELVRFAKRNIYGVLGLISIGFLILTVVSVLDNFFKTCLIELIVKPGADALSQTLTLFGIELNYQQLIRCILIIVYIVIELIWFILWKRNRSYLPKNSKKIGLVVAIKTDNKEQKGMVDDLINRIEFLIYKHELSDQINIITLNSHQSAFISRIFTRYANKKNQLLNSDLKHLKGVKAKEIEEWKKLQKRIRGHFYVWGEIKKRNSKKCLIINGMVVHQEVSTVIEREITSDFVSVWYTKNEIDNDTDFTTFELSADRVVTASEYIIGVAALISKDVFTAFLFHEKLVKNISNLNLFPASSGKISNKLLKLAEKEAEVIARHYYFIGDIKKLNEYIEKILSINPNSYVAYLLKAIYQRETGEHPTVILSTIKCAKKYAPNDDSWKYSEAFILMCYDYISKADDRYKKLCRTGIIEKESEMLSQICYDIGIYLRKNPDKIQFHYVLGLLNYKKIGNYPEALYQFDKFIELSQDLIKYNIFIEKAKDYIEELQDKLDLHI